MEEKEMTLERLYEIYDNDGYYVNMDFLQKDWGCSFWNRRKK